MTKQSLSSLLGEIRGCRLCAPALPHGVRPVLRASATARILIVGQAPGRRVHASGIPFDDPSGDRLRAWMGVPAEVFYDEAKIAIVPMGFCYPGTGKSGDLPPRTECAETWRDRLLGQLTAVKLTLVVGSYAARWHLGTGKTSLTEVVRGWQSHLPDVIPMPHPSPRNLLWLKRNPWFEADVVPHMQERIAALLGS